MHIFHIYEEITYPLPGEERQTKK